MGTILGFIKSVISPVTNLVDGLVKDKDLAQKLKAELNTQLIDSFMAQLSAQKDVLVAEITSSSFLSANWRPILMLSFTAVIINNYIISPYLQALFGFSVMMDIPPNMWDLLTIGIGGYIVGRSGEKMVKHWKK